MVTFPLGFGRLLGFWQGEDENSNCLQWLSQAQGPTCPLG